MEQAEHLANREPELPLQASLRRAVSAAYYSLFHLLLDEATRFLPSDPPDLRQQARRQVGHDQIGLLCKRCLDGRVLDVRIPEESDIAKIAEIVVRLYQARVDADYDMSEPFDRLKVLKSH